MTTPIRDAVKTILDSGGTVFYDYKKDLQDCYDELRLSSMPNDEGVLIYYAQGGPLHTTTTDQKRAIDDFVKVAYSADNLALVKDKALLHKLGEIDFTEDDPDEIEEIKRIYRDAYFSKDFPEFAG